MSIQNSTLETTSTARGHFGQLLSAPGWVSALVKELDGVAWETGIESDKKHRGESVNVDVYGVDAAQGLAVVQVRWCRFHPRRWNKVRKDYYLIGRNENGNAFAHPVDSPARSKTALATVDGPVRFVLAKIWECRESQLAGLIRNGDVALIPMAKIDQKRIAAMLEKWDGQRVLIADSHLVEAEEIFTRGSELYARGAVTIRHTKGQHPTVSGAGFWRVQHGVRAATWGFTHPTAD